MSQGAISQHIATLERVYGVKLLERGAEEITLTSAGELALRTAYEILAAEKILRRDVDKTMSSALSTIQIAASTIPGEHLLPIMIKEFRSIRPDANLRVNIVDSREAWRQLRDNQVDFAAIGTLTENLQAYELIELATEELVLVVPTDHALASKTNANVKEILRQPFISREAGSGTRKEIESMFRSVGLSWSEFNVVAQLGSTEAVMGAVQQGIGVSIVSSIAAEKAARNMLIRIVHLSDLDTARKLFLARRKGMRLRSILPEISAGNSGVLSFLGDHFLLHECLMKQQRLKPDSSIPKYGISGSGVRGMEQKIEGKRLLVTGGCGFIGSHLVDTLISRVNEVTILDNLSSSTLEYVRQHVTKKKARFVKGDIRDFRIVSRLCSEKDAVFHFAAQPDVRLSLTQPLEDFETNVKGTLNVLEGARTREVPLFVFASTSTVYGQASVIPTPESYPIAPISNYGASKSACETYMMAYSSCYGMSCVSLRYANIFGDRSNHGVVHDFFTKLKRDPLRLDVLGDGKQKKSYVYISDCIEASILAAEKGSKKGFEAFNIGSNEQVEVNEIARVVIEQLGISGVRFSYTGGKAGWIGDVTDMLLDTAKIRDLGWQTKVDTKEGIRRYVSWLKQKYA